MVKTLVGGDTAGTFLNVIKTVYDKPTANIKLSGEKLKAFSLRSGTEWCQHHGRVSSPLRLFLLRYNEKAIHIPTEDVHTTQKTSERPTQPYMRKWRCWSPWRKRKELRRVPLPPQWHQAWDLVCEHLWEESEKGRLSAGIPWLSQFPCNPWESPTQRQLNYCKSVFIKPAPQESR